MSDDSTVSLKIVFDDQGAVQSVETLDGKLKALKPRAEEGESAFSHLGTVIAGVFTGEALFAGAERLKGMIEGLIERSLEFAIAGSRAEETLAAAYEQQGLAARGLTNDYSEYVDQLARATGVENDAIKRGAQFTVSQGIMGKELRDVTAIALGLVTVKHMDAEEAMRTATLGSEGMLRATKQLGIEVDASASKQDRANQFMDQAGRLYGSIATNVGGAAREIDKANESLRQSEEFMGKRLLPLWVEMKRRAAEFGVAIVAGFSTIPQMERFETAAEKAASTLERARDAAYDARRAHESFAAATAKPIKVTITYDKHEAEADAEHEKVMQKINDFSVRLANGPTARVLAEYKAAIGSINQEFKDATAEDRAALASLVESHKHSELAKIQDELTQKFLVFKAQMTDDKQGQVLAKWRADLVEIRTNLNELTAKEKIDLTKLINTHGMHELGKAAAGELMDGLKAMPLKNLKIADQLSAPLIEDILFGFGGNTVSGGLTPTAKAKLEMWKRDLYTLWGSLPAPAEGPDGSMGKIFGMDEKTVRAQADAAFRVFNLELGQKRTAINATSILSKDVFTPRDLQLLSLFSSAIGDTDPKLLKLVQYTKLLAQNSAEAAIARKKLADTMDPKEIKKIEDASNSLRGMIDLTKLSGDALGGVIAAVAQNIASGGGTIADAIKKMSSQILIAQGTHLIMQGAGQVAMFGPWSVTPDPVKFAGGWKQIAVGGLLTAAGAAIGAIGGGGGSGSGGGGVSGGSTVGGGPGSAFNPINTTNQPSLININPVSSVQGQQAQQIGAVAAAVDRLNAKLDTATPGHFLTLAAEDQRAVGRFADRLYSGQHYDAAVTIARSSRG